MSSRPDLVHLDASDQMSQPEVIAPCTQLIDAVLGNVARRTRLMEIVMLDDKVRIVVLIKRDDGKTKVARLYHLSYDFASGAALDCEKNKHVEQLRLGTAPLGV
jgi:hypothetical protein